LSRRKPRILLDECIDRLLAAALKPYQAKTVPKMGWAGCKNGQLLTRAQAEFDVFITVDRNLSFQQDVSRYESSSSCSEARRTGCRIYCRLYPR